MHGLTGMRIVPHLLAREVRDEWKVERHPIPKKRKQWSVVKHHIDRPGCYQIGNTFYMHPELVEKLKQATTPSNVKWTPRKVYKNTAQGVYYGSSSVTS
jgi:NAD-dependent oxidoreductase involved in siderophore biosynthesis